MTEQSKKIRTLTGKITSDCMDKTIAVEIVRKIPHPKYKKPINRYTKLLVHDAENIGKVGDIAVIRSVRPISKRKNYQLVSIIQ